MSIRNVCEDRALQAMTCSILIFGPKEANRYALEEKKEEVHGAKDHNDSEGRVNDDSLITFT